jgi:hypothetical protein
MMTKKRGVGSAIKGFGAVFSETTEQAKKPVPVDVDFEKQKNCGTVDTPTQKRIPQPTSF